MSREGFNANTEGHTPPSTLSAIATRTLRAASTVVYPPAFLARIDRACRRARELGRRSTGRHGDRRSPRKSPHYKSSYSTTPVFYLVKQKPRNLVADLAAYPFAARALPGD